MSRYSAGTQGALLTSGASNANSKKSTSSFSILPSPIKEHVVNPIFDPIFYPIGPNKKTKSHGNR